MCVFSLFRGLATRLRVEHCGFILIRGAFYSMRIPGLQGDKEYNSIEYGSIFLEFENFSCIFVLDIVYCIFLTHDKNRAGKRVE